MDIEIDAADCDFGTCLKVLHVVVAYHFDAGRPPGVKEHLRHKRSGQDRQVRPIHPWVDQGRPRAANAIIVPV